LLAWTFLASSLIGAAFTVNAFLPLRVRRLLYASFFAGWLTIELALHHLVWQGAATATFLAFGVLEHWAGRVALAITVLSWLGMVAMLLASRHAIVTVRKSMQGSDLHIGRDAPHYPRLRLLFPWLAFTRPRARLTRNVPFAEAEGHKLYLDVFEPPERPAPGELRPAIIQVHGGAWRIDYKQYQGVTLLDHLAVNGWVGFNIDYRLSPAATFPDHLVDVKRAIAWVRDHGAQFGADPDFVVITGGSAGAHLAALAALTAGDRRYQPGFEGADTSVRAAAAMYGVYDFTNRLGTRPPRYRQMLEEVVMKCRYDEHPTEFSRASPIDRVHRSAPPFFVVHGSADSLTPVLDARYFVDKLRQVSTSPVVYAELVGAQHAFDTFPSIRSVAVIEAVERFFAVTYRRWREGLERSGMAAEAESELGSSTQLAGGAR
jgi:acetyl esterase/lipase